MKKTSKIIIVLSLIVVISLTLVLMTQKKDIQENNEFKSLNNDMISIMLQKEFGSGEYIESTTTSFPQEYYNFNAKLSKCLNGSKLKYNKDTKSVDVETVKTDKCYAYFDKEAVNEEYKFNQSYYTFTANLDGVYKIELWGAQGGDTDPYKGGRGAYVVGNIELKAGDKLYVFVGGAGTTISNSTISGGYNGGAGASTNSANDVAGSGGGATDVRIEISSDGAWDNFDSLKSRIMVAAGGGGAYNHYKFNGHGSAGGALNGIIPENVTCTNEGNRHYFSGSPASQNKVSSSHECGTSVNANSSSFGKGGIGSFWYAGGGGGYYGGGYGFATGASGGNSFISGYPGCNAIAKGSTSSSITHTGSATHYSGKIFTESKMIPGNEEMPKPDGGTEVGHEGNGYAKITLVK